MPKIEKALRREAKQRKVRDNETMGVRTPTLRAGVGLITREIRRKTRLKKAQRRR